MKLVAVHCRKCTHRQELFVRTMVPFGELLAPDEEADVVCEVCGAGSDNLVRLPNSSGIKYNTNGFYDTDYRGKTSR